MKIKNVKRSAMVMALTASFILPQGPQAASAKEESNAAAWDLFSGTAGPTSDTGLFPSTPSLSTPNNNRGNTSTNKNLGTTKIQGSAASMSAARVPETYSCPLFENRPHEELISAIDALNKEVKASPECNGTPSAKSLEENGNVIKESISTLQALMALQDPAQVNTAQIDSSMASALSAVGNLGDIVNNNNFLNSKCGKQTMSTGKVLLALNDVINGLTPYALFAVSMNAALAPALPFVVGGAIATSGISAVAKMIDQNTLNMTNPEHRRAVLQNTCQYTKVAKKVRFMQLAQSGKIDKITKELETSLDLYNSKYSNTNNREISALLKYRDTATKITQALEGQLKNDKADLQTLDTEVTANNDDLMMCTLTNELVNWAKDGKSFPTSAFLNFEAATAQSDRTAKLQAATMKTLHLNSMKRVSENAARAFEDENALKACAQAGRSWLAGIRQAIALTSSIVNKAKVDLEAELSRSEEYRQWKAQYTRIEVQKVTIKRVEKAMQELAKDNSIIDRSELAQRMVTLKSGLFGSSSAWGFGTPPVLAWMDHTKKMHDQAVSAFITSVKTVRASSFSLTDAGLSRSGKVTSNGSRYVDALTQGESLRIAKNLENINLEMLPQGSREHEIMCQQLESAWLDWSASIDHLGAVQFFCDMIDPVLDAKMDRSVIKACRGDVKINGDIVQASTVNQARNVLISKGYQADAKLVGEKLKALQCPMPAVSVMNQ